MICILVHFLTSIINLLLFQIHVWKKDNLLWFVFQSCTIITGFTMSLLFMLSIVQSVHIVLFCFNILYFLVINVYFSVFDMFIILCIYYYIKRIEKKRRVIQSYGLNNSKDTLMMMNEVIKAIVTDGVGIMQKRNSKTASNAKCYRTTL